MINRHSLRSVTGLLALANILLLVTLNLAACSDTSTAPENDPATSAPVLPEAETLSFDFRFFTESDLPAKAAGDHDHFVNAYLRAVVLDAMGRLVLAAPVSAFSAALNTTPVPDEDGSWVWSYDWTDGQEVVTIVLRGLPDGEQVAWSLGLRPSGTDQVFEWFHGTTMDDGQTGHWSFRDLDDPEFPVVGEISWGLLGDGHFLQFLSLEEDSHGDTLRFEDRDPEYAILFTEGLNNQISHIRWNADGSGSLRVPDYNGGLQACWDTYQRNTVCPRIERRKKGAFQEGGPFSLSPAGSEPEGEPQPEAGAPGGLAHLPVVILAPVFRPGSSLHLQVVGEGEDPLHLETEMAVEEDLQAAARHRAGPEGGDAALFIRQIQDLPGTPEAPPQEGLQRVPLPKKDRAREQGLDIHQVLLAPGNGMPETGDLPGQEKAVADTAAQGKTQAPVGGPVHLAVQGEAREDVPLAAPGPPGLQGHEPVIQIASRFHVLGPRGLSRQDQQQDQRPEDEPSHAPSSRFRP